MNNHSLSIEGRRFVEDLMFAFLLYRAGLLLLLSLLLLC